MIKLILISTVKEQKILKLQFKKIQKYASDTKKTYLKDSPFLYAQCLRPHDFDQRPTKKKKNIRTIFNGYNFNNLPIQTLFIQHGFQYYVFILETLTI